MKHYISIRHLIATVFEKKKLSRFGNTFWSLETGATESFFFFFLYIHKHH